MILGTLDKLTPLFFLSKSLEQPTQSSLKLILKKHISRRILQIFSK